MAIIQKADGVIQYYVQVGGYSFPILGSPYINLAKAVNRLYGVVPEGYLKIAPTGNFSIMAGNLPTLFGAEYTFTFENMNIERGLLWNQENVINRGLQLNYSYGPLAASVSWNNGFYSHSYTWVDGSLAWTINPANTLSIVGGGNAGFATSTNFATPLLNNNGQIYNVIYTFNAAPFVITPWFQETNIPFNPDIGVRKSTQTLSGAILASYAVTDMISVAGRAEYLGTTGNENSPKGSAANLLYGVGSDAWSLTLTPTFQWKQFFFRGEVSYVQANSYAPGEVFGKEGMNNSQVRGLDRNRRHILMTETARRKFTAGYEVRLSRQSPCAGRRAAVPAVRRPTYSLCGEFPAAVRFQTKKSGRSIRYTGGCEHRAGRRDDGRSDPRRLASTSRRWRLSSARSRKSLL